MRQLEFYRAWLLVPIALPLVLMALGAVTPHPPEPWLGLWVYLAMSLPFGGVPYVLVAVFTYRWLPGRPPMHVRLLAACLPFPMIAFNALFVHVPWQVVVGITYGYVVVFLASELLLRRAGWLRDASAGA